MSEPVRVSKVAAALGVDRGTVYRYVRNGWLANRGTPSHPLVIIEEARAAGVGLWGRGRARRAGAKAVDAEAVVGVEAAGPLENYSDPLPSGVTVEEASEPAAAELVGVNEAARRLGIDPSQVSRQIKAGIIPNRGTADRPLVDVEEARQARAVGLDRSKQRGPGAPLFAAPSPAAGADASSSAQRDNETYQAARARREAVAAQMAEIDLALRKGELIVAAAATREWSTALNELIAAIERFILDLPEKLGLGRDAVDICRREWRAFRQRQSDQAAAQVTGASSAAADPENRFSGPPAAESAGPTLT